MDLKITIETSQSDLIDKILELVKGEAAKVKVEKSKTIKQIEVGDLLDSLAKSHPVNSIKDPKEWQREIREDRALPF
ncbi:hypothetical protein SAMN03080617_02769 [Algoriphagus alkaliphilus]|uniref:Uncharacterized protein n=1 Tax=Algoriphagus alkaliphilus TaxID=279824 RepID=A0A1G5YR88_9BACT|nr:MULTISPECIES: hypothetical protein [Algoriphagus]MDP2039979.1 hypothetical protein [Algoriphagus sp.]MDP3470436.1 hypothetical protein [Algoriphagus sp.]SDA84892.1 hypothetical protein SAMN03080617_02769 [Algoriphagus alkaliphilus]